MRGIAESSLGLSESSEKTCHTDFHSFSNTFFNKVVLLDGLERKRWWGR